MISSHFTRKGCHLAKTRPHYAAVMKSLKAIFFLSYFLWISLQQVRAQEVPQHHAVFPRPDFTAPVTATALEESGYYLLANKSLLGLADIRLLNARDCEDVPDICPLRQDSRQRLENFIPDGLITSETGAQRDRYGRHLAQIATSRGLWLQEDLISKGYARVMPQQGDPAIIRHLLSLEALARQENRGLWAHRPFQPFTAENARQGLDHYQLVEGLVIRTAKVRDSLYLNFGDDWRQDFTIKLNRDAWNSFPDKGAGLLTLSGTRLRVRGWLFWENGPMISLYSPLQLEILFSPEIKTTEPE
ncbi:thermonuclease family protein [Kiloniella laminariae]|uniref:Thermonuclease family protein n=1 Tax=Kiloniella laminariae TaxID=454162 RepID=A0ABT4LK34_9PROT|nr:thermonuclease family protein [Kiloniella laminariae]MCZ4281467.1 thermonuclease family protein [Kiloniella laminariae]